MPFPIDKPALTSLYREHIAWLSREYARVAKDTGCDSIVIHSGTPQKRSVFDDQFWPQRAVPHFQHWLPLVWPHSALVIEAGRKPRLLWANAVDFWEAPTLPESDHFWASFDVVEVKGGLQMKDLMPKGRRAFIGEDRADAEAWGFTAKEFVPDAVLKALDALRIHKTPYEMACLREANRRASLGHAKVIETFGKQDLSELQLHLLYLEATEQDDPETPYKNIVALGEHAATLHHVGYSRSATAAQTLLLDAGCRFLGYDSDVTRTAIKGKGHAADVFAALIARVEAMQQELCARVKKGLLYEQLHNQSHELLAPILRDVGIARGSDSELVDRGVTRRFLPHGLGHSLGLQTHDVGCRNVEPESRNPWLRNTTRVSPGQVFTIEPGCYFIPSLLDELKASPESSLVDWDVVAALRPFGGVRIEDDLAVSEKGPENLTRAFLPS